MYELLIEQLRTCSCTSTCETCPYGYEHCEDNLIKNAADAIEELQGRAKVLEKVADKWCEAVPKWIPVTERLPVNTNPVLIVHRGGVSTGWYNGRYWERGANTNHRPIQTVTHWMPFPEPPKEGK